MTVTLYQKISQTSLIQLIRNSLLLMLFQTRYIILSCPPIWFLSMKTLPESPAHNSHPVTGKFHHILWNRKTPSLEYDSSNSHKCKCRAQNHCIKQISLFVQHPENIQILHRTLRSEWKKKIYRLTAKELGHNGSPNAELHHFYSNEQWTYFQANLPITRKEF